MAGRNVGQRYPQRLGPRRKLVWATHQLSGARASGALTVENMLNQQNPEVGPYRHGDAT